MVMILKLYMTRFSFCILWDCIPWLIYVNIQEIEMTQVRVRRVLLGCLTGEVWDLGLCIGWRGHREEVEAACNKVDTCSRSSLSY